MQLKRVISIAFDVVPDHFLQTGIAEVASVDGGRIE